MEVRYIAPPDETLKAQVDDNLWARAQAVVAEDLAASIAERAPDLTIPAPYTIDAQGNKATHEWTVTKATSTDPATPDSYVLTVFFDVPLLGYPIALDPTLQFTAPGVSNAGAYITGETTNNYFGNAMTTGDWNADGKTDLAVGAYNYNSAQGRVYIFYGGNTTPTTATSADVVLTGEVTNNEFGYSLTAGDLNNDGKDDLIVGAPSYNLAQGRIYVFYNGSITSKNASVADFKISGEAGVHFGKLLMTGDFNSDSRVDIGVCGDYYNNVTGRVYVFYNDSSVPTDAASADVIITGEATYSYTSSLVAGDFNADGRTDFAIGAWHYSSNTGRVWVFYNDGTSFGTVVCTNDCLASNADTMITGEAATYLFGTSLATGDFNADGKDDLAVGSENANSSAIGRAYIFYNLSLKNLMQQL